MSLERGDFENLEESDLQELVDGQVPESARLEFKRDCYGDKSSDKKEFLKDVSALANSRGGYLLIGIEEQDGVASTIHGLEASKRESEAARLTQILNTGVEPRIAGIRIVTVALSSGKCVICIRIPPSWNPPHRVTTQGTNKFYVRHGTTVNQPDMDELRALFTQSSSVLRDAKDFRDQRVLEVTKSDAYLVGPGKVFVHIMPAAAFRGSVWLDLSAARDLCDQFAPIGSSGWSTGFNLHGLCIADRYDGVQSYTQVFRNGCVEVGVGKRIVPSGQYLLIAGTNLEKATIQKLPRYLAALEALEVPPPFVVTVTLTNVLGAHYAVWLRSTAELDKGSSFTSDIIALPEGHIDDYGPPESYHAAVQPAFDSLWNSAGHPRCEFFDANGVWRDQPSQ